MWQRSGLILTVLLSALVGLVSPGAAAPGDPDPTFGVGGTATDFVNGVTIRKVVLQPDGKIIVVGSKKLTIQIGDPPKDYLFIRRYTATGVLETTFNTSLKQGIGYDAEVQPDGKVVVIGQAPNTVTSPFGVTVNTTSPVVWRFNGNGTLDTNFGSNGARFVNAQSGGNLGIEVFNTYIVITFASRNLFLLGDYSYKVSRLTENGSFDNTITLPFPYAQYADVTVKLDPLTSDIVALGSNEVRRYSIDGAVVTSFGTNGVAPVPYCFYYPGLPLSQKDMEIQPDGGILVIRTYDHQYGTAVGISRQNSNGTPDPALCISSGGNTFGDVDLLLQPDGRFFFYGGNSTGYRFFPDGNPATNVSNHTPYPQVIQPDQKLVTATATPGAVQLTRRMLD